MKNFLRRKETEIGHFVVFDFHKQTDGLIERGRGKSR